MPTDATVRRAWGPDGRCTSGGVLSHCFHKVDLLWNTTKVGGHTNISFSQTQKWVPGDEHPLFGHQRIECDSGDTKNILVKAASGSAIIQTIFGVLSYRISPLATNLQFCLHLIVKYGRHSGPSANAL